MAGAGPGPGAGRSREEAPPLQAGGGARGPIGTGVNPGQGPGIFGGEEAGCLARFLVRGIWFGLANC